MPGQSKVLDAVDAGARDLVRVLASTRTGASSLPNYNPNADLDAQRPRRGGERRLEQLCQDRVAVATQANFKWRLREQQDLELSHESEDALYDMLDELNSNLRQAYNQRRREASLVQSVHESIVVTDAVYSNDTEDRDTDEDMAVLRRLVEERDKLCTQCLRLSDRHRDLNHKLEQINANFQQHAVDNRQLYAEIKGVEQQLKEGTPELPSQALDNARKMLENEFVKNAILRNILQLLVVASGVDWAADEDLTATMLSLDECPSFDD